MPLTSPYEPISPTAEFQGKSGLNPLGDFVLQTDAVIGQIVAALDKHQLAEGTLSLRGDNAA